MCPQDQEGFAEARKGEQGGDHDHPPIGRAQPPQFIAMQRHAYVPVCRSGPGLLHRDEEDADGQEGGNDGNPEHGLEMTGREPHQENGQKRACEGADRVERLTQAETRAAQMGRGHVGNQGIARGAANALADPVNEPRANKPADGTCHREDRFRDGGKAIADDGQSFAFAEPVAEGAGENLDDRRRGLGHALDDPDGHHRGAEHSHHIDGQQGVDHLRGDIHQHGDETERPDTGRDALTLHRFSSWASKTLHCIGVQQCIAVP